MLNKSEMDILHHILESREELIVDNAEEESLNADASIGVANFLVGGSDNFVKMSDNQKYHYDKVIKPLISHVSCDGMIGIHEDGSSSCIGNEFIEQEHLLTAYQLDDMRCRQCISTSESWHANNP